MDTPRPPPRTNRTRRVAHPVQENAISSEVLRETLTNLEGKEAALVALEAKFNDKASPPSPLPPARVRKEGRDVSG